MSEKKAIDMKLTYLEFEQPIAELEKRIESLQAAHDAHDDLDVAKEVAQLQRKNEQLLVDTYKNLDGKATTITIDEKSTNVKVVKGDAFSKK